MKDGKIEVTSDIIETLSNLFGSEVNIFDFVSDSMPGLRIALKLYNSVSDKILKDKVDSFVDYANNFTSDLKVENFKLRITNDVDYKNRVTQYLLFKINKFDTDCKLKIFSCACVDFFNGIIDYDYLVDISECIDMIFKKDIEVLKCISNADKVFKPEDLNVKNISSESVISSVRKLHMISILEEKGTIQLKTFPSNPLPGQIGPSSTKSYSLSSLGKKFIKYL
ncbi:Uncharacterised protein [[Clostridium] sordellii]|uniref:hypothetical protein n=1 Tax=Paraclostridium sordellii TaxID=1505 RepID=UPI0005E6D8D5|nr:hypothetical protein [Paeniclostridium sordellii]CEN84148.1 Uncharacterised protein [[Clostridium] sordellii] [Paeniclostridium sordellii]CEO09684.1 Uncharacterised protein [[Clostridium] sordellii] [Paeniclostridium sordellii]